MAILQNPTCQMRPPGVGIPYFLDLRCVQVETLHCLPAISHPWTAVTSLMHFTMTKIKPEFYALTNILAGLKTHPVCSRAPQTTHASNLISHTQNRSTLSTAVTELVVCFQPRVTSMVDYRYGRCPHDLVAQTESNEV